MYTDRDRACAASAYAVCEGLTTKITEGSRGWGIPKTSDKPRRESGWLATCNRLEASGMDYADDQQTCRRGGLCFRAGLQRLIEVLQRQARQPRVLHGDDFAHGAPGRRARSSLSAQFLRCCHLHGPWSGGDAPGLCLATTRPQEERDNNMTLHERRRLLRLAAAASELDLGSGPAFLPPCTARIVTLGIGFEADLILTLGMAERRNAGKVKVCSIQTTEPWGAKTKQKSPPKQRGMGRIPGGSPAVGSRRMRDRGNPCSLSPSS